MTMSEVDPIRSAGAEPTATEAEDDARRVRANRATRGALAAILCLEAFVVLLIPRAIAQTAEGLNGPKTTALVVLAVVLIVTGFLLRRPWGIGLGSALQLVLAATIYLVPILAIVIVIFVALWLYLLQTRHQLLGTPSGWRMLIS
jgi:hypothetical protein